MSAAYTDGHYKPIRTCILLKECSKNQASLDADEMRSLRSLAINETINGDIPVQTTILSQDRNLTAAAAVLLGAT